ncbi:MAG: hypothetical protein ACYST9_00705 [Planctomycetota bacterium]
MTSFRTVQIPAKRTGLTGLKRGCAWLFDCHSVDMELVQTSFNSHLANYSEGMIMR